MRRTVHPPSPRSLSLSQRKPNFQRTLATHSQKDGAAGGSKGKAGAAGSGSKDPVTVALNTNNPLYAEIRDLHLEALGQTLNEKCVRAV